jgi:putative tryptophan/tyrosine transport system substrate-binding protein
MARDRPDALFVDAGSFFFGRRVQLVTAAARERIPASYPQREYVEAGGLMTYGTNTVDVFRQAAVFDFRNGSNTAVAAVRPARLQYLS